MLAADQCPDLVCIVGLVGNQDCELLEAVEQNLCASGVVTLAGRDQQADRAALRVDPRVDFRGEASSTSPTQPTPLFFHPRRVLMHPRQRAVDHLYLAVAGFRQGDPQTIPDTGLAPSVEAVVSGRVRPYLSNKSRKGAPARRTQKTLSSRVDLFCDADPNPLASRARWE